MLNTSVRAALHALCCSLCFTLVLLAGCSGRSAALVNQGNVATETNAADNDTLYYLDLNKPSIVQRIEPAQLEPGVTYKFVQVEVARVINPKLYALTFQVHYQLNNDKTYLGGFSLYPSDNPGKFLVATQGKVKHEGAIVLSLVAPEKVAAGDTIQVGVKKFKLLKS
jgi:hypothetical protein